MSCLFPLPYFSNGFTKSGKDSLVVLPRRPDYLAKYSRRLPCGKCKSCRLKKSREWAIRCVHEASLYTPTFENPFGRGSCFITLTYATKFLPTVSGVPTLVKEDFQKFLKRLRKKFVPVCPYPKVLFDDDPEGFVLRKQWMDRHCIRYYMAGEYGGQYGRPHFHAILFNWNFDFDKFFLKVSPSGFDLFRSPSLEEVWTYGYSTVADMSFDAAAYVARYSMKKISGDAALTRYAVLDEASGELFGDIQPEYNDMSRNPGIAKGWFDKYGDTLLPRDFVQHGGHKIGLPKYYDKCLELIYPEDLAMVKEVRSSKIVKTSEDRLEAIRKVKDRQVERLVRNVDKDL